MPSTKRPRRNAEKKEIEPITIARGDEIERVILKASRKRLDRRALHVTLEPIVRSWIRAACTWDSGAIGDHRFLIFSIDVAPETQVYVQFWSEPLEPVLWEVSSGRWNPPADEWLAGDRSKRIEALGFVIGGKAENFQRTVSIDSAADIADVAKTVVKIFYDGFDYRGTLPIRVHLAHDGRAQVQATYESFTPEDISKVFAGLGFRVEEAVPDNNEDDDSPPLIRCRKRGTDTVVQFDDRVEDDNLYRRIRLAADVEIPSEERARLKSDAAAPEGGEPVLTVSVVHAFDGGVTLEWLMARITEWDATLAEHRRLTRRANKAAIAAWVTETVH